VIASRRNPFPPAAALPRFVLVATLAVPACSDDARGGGDATPVVERRVSGDTTFVRIVSGSVWGAPVSVVEEMAIGMLEGPDELTFGEVQEMVPDGNGGVYVFDANPPSLRYYDESGAFVRRVGGRGQGPGEYEDAVLALAILSDGRLVLRDARNGRLNFYRPDGTPAGTQPVASGLFTSQAMTVDDRDHVYLKILTGPVPRDAPWPVGLLHLDPEGAIVDTIPSPAFPGEPLDSPNGVFLTSKEWVMTKRGQIVVGVSDRYLFDIRNRDGTVVRVEKEWTPVPVLQEERDEQQARLDWQWERQGQYMTAAMQPVPDHKPAFRGFSAGLDGTIWVQVHATAEKREATPSDDPEAPAPATWVEPRVYHVFEDDGSYLGEVRIPPRTSIMVFSRDRLWGIRRGELDEQYVVRLRVQDPRTRLETAAGG